MATINYNGVELDLQEFLTNAANEVQRYANNQPWSNKRKQKFLNAYADIMNHGVLGASVGENGIWNIDHNGTIDQTNMSKMDRQMYGEAAYFIQQLMHLLGTKNTKKEEELKKELPKFDNFGDNFGDYINKKYYGRSGDFSLKDLWNILDERDKTTGLLNTTNRLTTLKDYLINYRDSLKDGLYDFTDSPFESLDDLKSRLNNAIEGLNNGDINAINLIGLDPKLWFYNGSSDVVGTDENGNPITYVQQAEAANKIAETKTIEDALKANAIAQANRGVRDILSGIHGSDAKTNPEEYANKLAEKYGVGLEGFNRVNQRIQELFDKAYDTKVLNNADKKELGNLLFYIRKYNENYKTSNLSNEEWNELNKHQLSDTNRNNYIHLPWKTTRDGRNIFADGQGNVHFVKYSNKANLPNAFKRSLAAIDYRNNFLKSENTKALNNTIGNNNGLTDDMKADLTAMGLDLISAGSAFAPGYGTLASALTGIGATVSGAVADRMRGESWGSTLGTAGLGLSMDILGLIPGVGVGAKAAKIAKVVAKGAKWLGPALGGLAAMSYGPGAISAYNKFTSGKKDDITAEELRDFTYAIRAIAAGGIRKAGATYQGNRTLARAVKEGKAEISSGKLAAFITTKNGLKINLTDDEFKTLKSNASRETKAKTITQAALREKINMKEDEIEWKGINPIKGRFKTSSKSSKLSGLQEGTESSQIKWNTASADYKGIRRFNNENLLRGFTTMSTPSSGLWKTLKNRWTGNDILNKPLTSSNISVKELLKLLPLIKKEYNKPEMKSQNGIPISRALPQPGGIHKGNVVDNTKTGSLNSSRITLGDATKEFTDFNRMYIASSTKNSKVPSKPFGNGYGSSKEPENGSLNFNGITATLTKLNDNKGYSITFGKTEDTVIAKQYKNILQLRSEFAKKLNKVIKNLDNVKETAALLRQFKAKGWLKQGGQINRNVDTIISEFLSKLI